MSACGKALCCAAQQRIQLRPSLTRLYSDLDTFQSKASVDTQTTIERMEKQRLAYRAALLWMKSLSERLDPESMDQLGKFRRVQNHCRSRKLTFERLGIDCVQKVDMLAASRCNLLGHSLVNYQDGWLRFWTSSSATYDSIAGCLDRLASQQMQPSLPSAVVRSIDSDEKTNQNQMLKKLATLDGGGGAKGGSSESQLISLDDTVEEGREATEKEGRAGGRVQSKTDLLQLEEGQDDDLLSEFGRQLDSMMLATGQPGTPTGSDDLMQFWKDNGVDGQASANQGSKQFLERLIINQQSAADVNQLDDLLGGVDLLSLNEKTSSPMLTTREEGDDAKDWKTGNETDKPFLPSNLLKLGSFLKESSTKSGGVGGGEGAVKERKVDTMKKVCFLIVWFG